MVRTAFDKLPSRLDFTADTGREGPPNGTGLVNSSMQDIHAIMDGSDVPSGFASNGLFVFHDPTAVPRNPVPTPAPAPEPVEQHPDVSLAAYVMAQHGVIPTPFLALEFIAPRNRNTYV